MVWCGNASCVGNCSTCVSRFTRITSLQLAGSLVSKLTRPADAIRDLATRLGARQYDVHLVWIQWSGGQRGLGVETVIRDDILLPNPLVADLTSIDITIMPIGAEERGDLRVSEISPRYNEDYLRGLEMDGSPTPDDVEFYWEVHFQRIDGPGTRRRFTMSGVPNKNPTNFEWTVVLTRQLEDRQRDGNIAE